MMNTGLSIGSAFVSRRMAVSLSARRIYSLLRWAWSMWPAMRGSTADAGDVRPEVEKIAVFLAIRVLGAVRRPTDQHNQNRT
jgi:hypothetical protein